MNPRNTVADAYLVGALILGITIEELEAYLRVLFLVLSIVGVALSIYFRLWPRKGKRPLAEHD